MSLCKHGRGTQEEGLKGHASTSQRRRLTQRSLRTGKKTKECSTDREIAPDDSVVTMAAQQQERSRSEHAPASLLDGTRQNVHSPFKSQVYGREDVLYVPDVPGGALRPSLFVWSHSVLCSDWWRWVRSRGASIEVINAEMEPADQMSAQLQSK